MAVEYQDYYSTLGVSRTATDKEIRSAYRNTGDRLMMEGEKMYYEISAGVLVDFKHPSRHTYEFVELYGGTVYRITKVKFHSIY